MASTRDIIECGKALGLEAEDLVEYVSKESERLEKKEIEKREREKIEKETQLRLDLEAFERSERVAEREIKRLQIEEESKERERAEREREREHELKLAELKAKIGVSPPGSHHSSNESLSSSGDDPISLSDVLKLVPKFSEIDVSKFFLSFEKINESCEVS